MKLLDKYVPNKLKLLFLFINKKFINIYNYYKTMVEKSKKDTHSYEGWLNSDSFLKRAFAIYGYMIVAGLIIMIPIYIFMFLVVIMVSVL